jgi:hypothetical protein
MTKPSCFSPTRRSRIQDAPGNSKSEVRNSKIFGLGPFELVSDFKIRVSDLNLARFARDFARKRLNMERLADASVKMCVQ